MEILIPRALRPGDRVAAVTLSWGGPGTYPHRYQAGKTQFEEEFGLSLVEMPHTLADPSWVSENPEARAADLMAAFADPEIAGIVSSIGGDDSIRLLPFLDLNLMRAHPKPFVGYSDTTVTHLACLKAGLRSFYGPSVLSGFAENTGLHSYLADSFRKTLMQTEPIGELSPNLAGWTVQHLAWADPANQAIPRELAPGAPWKFLQGAGCHRGHLLGGCLEVLEWLRGTAIWPSKEQWKGAILFLETSEEAPPPAEVIRALRVYAAEGVLQELSGILFGRPGGRIPVSDFAAYDEAILQVVNREQGLGELPIVSGMDFGHTDPFLTLPYGAATEIDCDSKRITIEEAGVRD